MEKKIKRTKFFEMIGMISLTAVLSSLFPLKMFNRKKAIREKIKVHINPLAVKREKKV